MLRLSEAFSTSDASQFAVEGLSSCIFIFFFSFFFLSRSFSISCTIRAPQLLSAAVNSLSLSEFAEMMGNLYCRVENKDTKKYLDGIVISSCTHISALILFFFVFIQSASILSFSCFGFSRTLICTVSLLCAFTVLSFQLDVLNFSKISFFFFFFLFFLLFLVFARIRFPL